MLASAFDDNEAAHFSANNNDRKLQTSVLQGLINAESIDRANSVSSGIWESFTSMSGEDDSLYKVHFPSGASIR